MLAKFLQLIVCIGFMAASKGHADSLYADSLYNDCWKGGWFEAEYLYWKIQDAPDVIPLVVEGPVVPEGFPTLGSVGSQVVLGDKKVESKWRSGGRFTLGFWGCGHCDYAGFQLTYLFLGKSFTKQTIFSNGSPESSFFTIPFINSNSRQESSTILALPGAYEGRATLTVSNRLQGAELTSLVHVPCACGWSVDVLGGFRYLNFTENLKFNTNSPLIDPTLNDVFYTKDKFFVDNSFYGLELGSKLKYAYSGFLFDISWKLAFGAICQTCEIKGDFFTNEFNDFGAIQHFHSGYFALSSNRGQVRKYRFSVVPEAEVNLGYQLAEFCTLKAGYNFLYATNVLRASKQLKRLLNPTDSPVYTLTSNPALVGQPFPKKRLKATSLWVQGVNAGVEFIF